MNDTTFIATIAGVALGIGLVLLVIHLKNSSDGGGALYTYDEDNRLQAVTPISEKSVVLKPIRA